MGNRVKEIPEVNDNLRRVLRAVNEYSRNAERTTGLTGPQLWALKILDTAAPMKVSELARRMYLHPSTVVGILDRLEIKQMVTRARSREDRRVVELVLTDQGRNMVANAPEVAQAMLVQGLEALSDEEFRHVSEAMVLLMRILEADQSSLQSIPAP